MRQNREYIRELEDYIINSYNPAAIDSVPKTERELLSVYQTYTVPAYVYVSSMFRFVFPISNEIRAMLGHLSEYRAGEECRREELSSAYGHFRRINLDLLKTLCDEWDRSLGLILRRQYRYDYRNTCKNYLKLYGDQYFAAKNAYLEAQKQERVGRDSYAHNIFELYYKAVVQYILLKQFYEDHKKEIKKIKRKANMKKTFGWIAAVYGVLVTVWSMFL